MPHFISQPAPAGQAGSEPPIFSCSSMMTILGNTALSSSSAILPSSQHWTSGPCPFFLPFTLGIHVVSTPEPPLTNSDVPQSMVATWGQHAAGCSSWDLVGREQHFLSLIKTLHGGILSSSSKINKAILCLPVTAGHQVYIVLVRH